MIKKGYTIELNISDYAYGGKGIGSLKSNDNQVVVFVNHTIPGQKVRAVVKKKKSNYLEADIIEIISPSSVEICTRTFEPFSPLSLEAVLASPSSKAD